MSVTRAPEIPGIWADPDRVLTVEDMEDTPDDEFRYELDEGMLIVSPAPSLPHQIAIMQLAFALKREVYEQFGTCSYWIVDVDQDKPGLTVLELRRGRYTEAARVVGDEAFSAVRPFPVTIVPTDLLDAEPS